jgi:hypothetical protein
MVCDAKPSNHYNRRKGRERTTSPRLFLRLPSLSSLSLVRSVFVCVCVDLFRPFRIKYRGCRFSRLLARVSPPNPLSSPSLFAVWHSNTRLDLDDDKTETKTRDKHIGTTRGCRWRESFSRHICCFVLKKKSRCNTNNLLIGFFGRTLLRST